MRAQVATSRLSPALAACMLAGTPGGGPCPIPGESCCNTSADCNDGDVCTFDTCPAPGLPCSHIPVPNCCRDDSECSPSGPCVTATCDPGTHLCVQSNKPDNSTCDDGNLCTEQDACVGGVCVADPVSCPPSTEQCRLPGTCDPATGACTYANAPDSTPCDDGNACTTGETCQGGFCVAGRIPFLPCDDGNPCTDDICDPATGCSHTNNTAPCNDGNECTLDDHCAGGACVPGPAPDCDDNNPCTTDHCAPAAGLGESYVCLHDANTDPCDDGNACTGGDTCGGGRCNPGTPAACVSTNVCLTASCDPSVGCVLVPNANACEDGDICTFGDHCVDGACVPGQSVNCDDGNPCTDDSCGGGGRTPGGSNNPASVCSHIPNTAPCSDGNACTTGDICGAGVCHAGTAVNCDDGNPCTDDSCDPTLGCVHTNNTAPCSDGNACTTGDTCGGGVCNPGGPVGCDDGNPCTGDSCNPASGCVHTNIPGPCDDHNPCTVGDSCNAGVCVGGGPLSCDDGNPCTDDSCVPPGAAASGSPSPNPPSPCRHVANTAACSDGNACTANDTCSNGQCMPGTPLNCNDGNPCTDDSCNSATGCVHTNNTAPCEDGNICTTGDHCSGGSCVGGPPPNCDDGNPCTTDTCVPGCLGPNCTSPTGCRHVANTNPCDDGNACTTGDTCGGGTCHPGGPTNCDDGNCCTVDSCNPSTGCVHTASTTPPTITRQPSLGTTVLWPPQHGYTDFSVAATHAAATASCGTATIRFASCASSQPENATGTGDGNTLRDCVYEPDAVHLRAERDGACSPIGRVYTVGLVAVDACGNTTAFNNVQVGVFHDRAHPPQTGTIVSANPGSNTADARNGTNGTYGADCGTGIPAANGSIHDHSDLDPEMEIFQHASISVDNLRIDKVSSKLKLTWSEPAHQSGINVTRYHVYRLDPETLFWSQVAEVSKQTISYIDPVAGDGNNWQYKVAAVIK